MLIRYTDFVKDYMKKREGKKSKAADKDKIIEFIKYYETEKNALGDESLSEELAFLDMMLKVDYTDTWVERLALKSGEELKKELVKLGGVVDAAAKPEENQNNNNADDKEAEKASLIEKISNIVQPNKKTKEESKAEDKKEDEANMDTDATPSKTSKRKAPAKKQSARGKKKKN